MALDSGIHAGMTANLVILRIAEILDDYTLFSAEVNHCQAT